MYLYTGLVKTLCNCREDNMSYFVGVFSSLGGAREAMTKRAREVVRPDNVVLMVASRCDLDDPTTIEVVEEVPMEVL